MSARNILVKGGVAQPMAEAPKRDGRTKDILCRQRSDEENEKLSTYLMSKHQGSIRQFHPRIHKPGTHQIIVERWKGSNRLRERHRQLA